MLIELLFAWSPVVEPLRLTEFPQTKSVVDPAPPGAVKMPEKWMTPPEPGAFGEECVSSPLSSCVLPESGPPTESEPPPDVMRRFQPAAPPFALLTVTLMVVLVPVLMHVDEALIVTVGVAPPP